MLFEIFFFFKTVVCFGSFSFLLLLLVFNFRRNLCQAFFKVVVVTLRKILKTCLENSPGLMMTGFLRVYCIINHVRLLSRKYFYDHLLMRLGHSRSNE